MSSRKGQNAKPDGKMTIGELARRTGMTIRNIRAHQTRGLLPPPEVHGRTGYYNEDHVARIELTREMQAEGLNLEAIRRVLESSEGSSREMVDFARAVRAPFEDETPEIFDVDELASSWGVETFDPSLLARVEKLGIVRQLPDGKVEVFSPRLQRAGTALVELGVSPQAVVETAEELRRASEKVSRTFVELFVRGDLGALRQGRPPRGGLAEGARGARPDAPARLRRAAGDVPDHDGRVDRESRRTHPPRRRPTVRQTPPQTLV